MLTAMIIFFLVGVLIVFAFTMGNRDGSRND